MMSREEIRLEVRKLSRRHKIQRWVDVSFGVLLVIGGFAASASTGIRALIPENPAFFLCAIGGGILGVVTKNWQGSPALRLLEKSFS